MSSQNASPAEPLTHHVTTPSEFLTKPDWVCEKKNQRWFQSSRERFDSMSCKKVHKNLLFPQTSVLLAEEAHAIKLFFRTLEPLWNFLQTWSRLVRNSNRQFLTPYFGFCPTYSLSTYSLETKVYTFGGKLSVLGVHEWLILPIPKRFCSVFCVSNFQLPTCNLTWIVQNVPH